MTFYGLALGLAAAFGQLLGGGLISADLAGLGWRWCFLINILVGVISLVAVRPLVPFAAPIGSRPLALGFFATSLSALPLLARFGDRFLIAGAVLLLAAYMGEYTLVSDRVALTVLLTVNGFGQPPPCDLGQRAP